MKPPTASTACSAPSAVLTERERRIKDALDAVRAGCDVASRREADPVGCVHRYSSALDRELVALVAACVAFGNVKAIRAKMADLLERLGPRPSRTAEHPAELQRRLRGWKHRVFRGDDVARLLIGARRVQRVHGSLGEFFRSELARGCPHARAKRESGRGPGAPHARAKRESGRQFGAPHARAKRESGRETWGTLREALGALCDAVRKAGGLGRGGPRRGPSHLLPDPRGPSGSKRLLLFLRWMIRPADGVDLGLWDVDAAALLVPVDVHIHKLARNLGFTRRHSPSWRTTEEITSALARFDPADPAKYDFSLCHMGMLQRCPSRRDPARCEGCGVKPVCIHWPPNAPTNQTSAANRGGSDMDEKSANERGNPP